jgi:hypothetical protein
LKQTVTIAAAGVTILGVTGAWAADVPTNAERPSDTIERPIAEQPSNTIERRWNATFASDVRFFSWRNNFAPPPDAPPGAKGKGSELYIPYALEIAGKPTDLFQVEIVGRGGWVKANQSTPGKSGEVAMSTDTVASATIAYLGWNGIQPFVAVQTNLPTGRSALFGTAANARMDPDLVEISTFGEGFNIGPTVGFAFPISNSLVLTTSAGYTWRGPFLREALLTATPPIIQVPTDLNPGNNLTITGSATFKAGELSGRLTGSFSKETATEQNGTQILRAGNRYLLTGTWAYAWPETPGEKPLGAKTWGVTTLTASVAHAGRNDILIAGASALTQELANSNSNVFRVGLEHLFPVGQFAAAGPTGSVLHRDRNGYDSATLQFVPRKLRWSAGLVARYAPSDTVTFNARFEGVWTHEDENPAFDDFKFSVTANDFVPAFAVPVVSGAAFQAAVGINVKLGDTK